MVSAGLSKIDFSYLEEYGNRKLYQIPSYMEKRPKEFRKGQHMDVRVSHVFDPSKFWIVSKHRELETFQKYLFRLYYPRQSEFRMPEDNILPETYCVVYIESGFYRGVIVDLISGLADEKVAQVFYFDYGMLGYVSLENIFNMDEQCLKVPQFAVRACLAGVCPINGVSWTGADVAKFNELCTKTVVIMTVVNVNFSLNYIEVLLRDPEDEGAPVHEQLLANKCAKVSIRAPYKEGDCGQFPYPYLLPTHRALESGKFLCTIHDVVYHSEISPLASFYPYQYRGPEQ